MNATTTTTELYLFCLIALVLFQVLFFIVITTLMHSALTQTLTQYKARIIKLETDFKQQSHNIDSMNKELEDILLDSASLTDELCKIKIAQENQSRLIKSIMKDTVKKTHV